MAVLRTVWAAPGFDGGLGPVGAGVELSDAVLPPGSWVRLRGMSSPEAATPEAVASVARLRASGVLPVSFVRSGSWPSGTRDKKGMVPLDLRDAYSRYRDDAARYGAAVTAWEIDNEPDIPFGPENPETYAAYLKASYWGVKKSEAGRVKGERADDRRRTEEGKKSEAGRVKGERADEVRATGEDASGGGRGRGETGSTGGQSSTAGDRGLWLRQKTGRPGLDVSNLKAHGSPSRLLPPASRPSAFGPQGSSTSNLGGGTASPLVLMAPLALPPGPFFERLMANDLLAYTDGFNYHYYGYAEDFTGVYRQFEDALTRASERANRANTEARKKAGTGSAELDDLGSPSSNWRAGDAAPHHDLRSLRRKELPVFLTEYGYGLLGKEPRNTVEGRVRQWRWFREVWDQVRRLRIEGPMAFYLPPYFEGDHNEFGLTMKAKDEGRAKVETAEEKQKGAAGTFRAGGVSFGPGDFDEKRERPWMRFIGRKVAGNDASPALAYLLEEGRRGYRSKSWQVMTPPPSPVVIDLVAGADMQAMKSFGGYLLLKENGAAGVEVSGEAARSPTQAMAFTGSGELRVYNFADHPVRGRLVVSADAGAGVTADAPAEVFALAPLEMKVLPLRFVVDGTRYQPHALTVRFVAEQAVPTAVFSTQFYPSVVRMDRSVVARFDHAAAAAESNRRVLETRVLARDEPRVRPQGRWLATEGVIVTEPEQEGTWRFRVTQLPREALRPAVVELPLPENFVFPAHGVLSLSYRLTEHAPQQPWGMLEVYFRTKNGNLFEVQPRLWARREWTSYAQMKENFTMAFWGRSELPWRFSDNQPVALVFFLRPRGLPVTFEVRDAEIVSYESGRAAARNDE